MGLSASCYNSTSDCYEYMRNLREFYIRSEFNNMFIHGKHLASMQETGYKCCLVPNELRYKISSNIIHSCEPYYSTVCEDVRKNVENEFDIRLPNIYPHQFDDEVLSDAKSLYGTAHIYVCVILITMGCMLLVGSCLWAATNKPIDVPSKRAKKVRRKKKYPFNAKNLHTKNIRRKKKCLFNAENVRTGLVSASGEIENVATPQLENIASQLEGVARKVLYLSSGVVNLPTQLDNLTSQLENVDGPVENLVNQYENVCSQVENVASQFENMTSKFSIVGSSIENVAGKLGNVVSIFENVARKFKL